MKLREFIINSICSIFLEDETIPEAAPAAATTATSARNLTPEVKTVSSPKQALKSKKGKKRR
jgi:hypothetical protein